MALAGLGCISVLSAAQADDMFTTINRSVYLEGRLGTPIPINHDVTTTSNVAAANGTIDTHFRHGIAGAASVGAYLMTNVRGEVEASIVHTQSPSMNFNTGFAGNPFQNQKLDATGTVDAFSMMFNGIYDFSMLKFYGITPFAGAGIGFTHLRVDSLAPGNARFIPSDSDTVIGGQIIAGLDYPLNESFTLTGRYQLGITGGASFKGTDTANAGGTLTATTDTMLNHIFTVGLRLKL